MSLSYRRARVSDLAWLIRCYAEGAVGDLKERLPGPDDTVDAAYTAAFKAIHDNPDHLLIIVEQQDKAGATPVGTCHAVFIPNVLFHATPRLLVEAVHVSANHQGQGIGAWMFDVVEQLGRERWGAQQPFIIELTSNRVRARAHAFYQRLGFEPTHTGMKKWVVPASPCITTHD